MARVVQPAGNFTGVESDEPSDLEVGNSPLRDESADVTDADAEPVGELIDAEQLGSASGFAIVVSVQGAPGIDEALRQ
jgi:hypothetical protein